MQYEKPEVIKGESLAAVTAQGLIITYQVPE